MLQMQLLSPDGADHLPPVLREDWLLACTIAADTAEAYGIHWPELQPQSCEAAYGTVRLSDNHEAIQRALAQARLAVGWRPEGNAVRRRTQAAYAAATLLRAGGDEDIRLAIELANTVLQALQPQGRLYSTLDSVAAIALLNELRIRGWGGDQATFLVDGRQMPLDDAMRRAESIQSLRVLEGRVLVEIVRLAEYDWTSYSSTVPVRVALSQYGVPRTHG